MTVAQDQNLSDPTLSETKMNFMSVSHHGGGGDNTAGEPCNEQRLAGRRGLIIRGHACVCRFFVSHVVSRVSGLERRCVCFSDTLGEIERDAFSFWCRSSPCPYVVSAEKENASNTSDQLGGAGMWTAKKQERLCWHCLLSFM